MTSQESRAILEQWLQRRSEAGIHNLPIVDEVVHTGLAGNTMQSYTFLGLLKIAYNLRDDYISEWQKEEEEKYKDWVKGRFLILERDGVKALWKILHRQEDVLSIEGQRNYTCDYLYHIGFRLSEEQA